MIAQNREVFHQFKTLNALGRYAALDINPKTGKLVLMCTKQTQDIKTWGRGLAVSIPHHYSIRVLITDALADNKD